METFISWWCATISPNGLKHLPYPTKRPQRLVVEEIIYRFSVPERLHFDQDRQFEANIMMEIFKLLHINKTRTAPYHPQSDGLVERFNRTVIGMLAATVEEHPGDRDKHLRAVCMAYNTSVHPSTGFSPFFMMFGRQAKIPLDLVYGSTPTEEATYPEHVRRIKSTLEEAYSRVRESTWTQH